MNSKELVVRIVKPSPEPALPQAKSPLTANLSKKGGLLFSKPLNILMGSGIGLAAGTIIYLMLKLIGLNFGGLESSLIIGLPSVVGILTSIVIF